MLEAILKYQLQFINEYGELETVEPGSWAGESLGAPGEALGAGG